MAALKLTIDGREAAGLEGQSILDIARANGIEIPTLCEDARVEVYGACGLCVVECEGTQKLLRACATEARNGMAVRTASERVVQSRKTALELLLSDHSGDCRPPCALACPAQTDCQGYVGLIANGEYRAALQLVKEKIPLPASIGRVCPHPCETACRRKLVEAPVSIAALKQFLGERALACHETDQIAIAAPTGKSVAIVGGGPGGLTAAYFLRAQGHSVAVYDAMPQMGGMLRYGIPEYRLPKRLLQEEIDAIAATGMVFHNNVKIGNDISLSQLRAAHDAVVVAIGAWTSTALRCPGEALEGVVGGIDFLRDAAFCRPSLAGQTIAVVGGGNTAMDACRTAVRLGAAAVYNIYRRTRNEMPAEEMEIAQALEEGVIFRNLTNPLEVLGENGKVRAVRLQQMELGEPDASGRRRPVPVAGKEETLAIDMLLVAIGQKPNTQGLEALAQTRWGTLVADETTFLTNLPGVFALGDATNNGADIAITAIGEARRAAEMVQKYLQGESLAFCAPFLVKSEKTAEDFANLPKMPRAQAHCRPAAQRRNDFHEVAGGLTEAQARQEAFRCLECGCQDFFECRLLQYANQYQVQPEKYAGKRNHYPQANDHPHIRRNPEKCILCGLCVRTCEQAAGAAALGLWGRGFETVVQPALGLALERTACISCGQCVAVCPTGALTETTLLQKRVPLREEFTEAVCGGCSAGCKLRLATKGRLLVRCLPAAEKDALLCQNGRFPGEGGPRLRAPEARGRIACLDELDRADWIVAVAPGDILLRRVPGMRIRRAVRSGAQLLLISSAPCLLDDIAALRVAQGADFLPALQAALQGEAAGPQAQAAAQKIKSAQKIVFISDACTCDGLAAWGAVIHLHEILAN
jgi:formate dehydrogenase major subunit